MTEMGFRGRSGAGLLAQCVGWVGGAAERFPWPGDSHPRFPLKMRAV
jgi:hypothetical protein